MPSFLIKTSIIYANCRKSHKIPLCFVVDAAVGMAIVYSHRLCYLSEHRIVPILSCYSHREFLTFVVMALLAMPPHHRIRRLLSIFVLMLSPSRIRILRYFPMYSPFFPEFSQPTQVITVIPNFITVILSSFLDRWSCVPFPAVRC